LVEAGESEFLTPLSSRNLLILLKYRIAWYGEFAHWGTRRVHFVRPLQPKTSSRSVPYPTVRPQLQ